MSITTFTRAASGSLLRGLWNRSRAAGLRRRGRRDGFRPAIDQLESRRALAITTPLSIGGTTVGSFLDAPNGPGNVSDFVTVSIEGTRGTVIFNGGSGVADGTNIQTIEIVDASPDFQLTFGATIQTANAVPYGSDGVVQLGAITTANVIRGVNTVRGPLTNVAPTTGVASPIGFTQTSAGSNTMTLEGDQTSIFEVNDFVCATPLLSNTTVGAPSFGTITAISFDSNTNLTTVVFDNTTAAGTTAGALTLAETVQPSFVLTSFVGVNFSNRTLKDGGGIFVDTVVGAPTVYGGQTIPDLGILLSQGLLAYSTIGIRDQLDAAVVLGTNASASADGRVLIESSTADSVIYVGAQTAKTSLNSKIELLGGAGPFAADVIFASTFNGVVNLGSRADGEFRFLRNVGPLAVLNAQGWDGVTVQGTFGGTLNSTANEGPEGLSLLVQRDLAGTARINSAGSVGLIVGGSILKGAQVSADSGTTFAVQGNVLGTIHAGSTRMQGSVGGSLTGATLVSSNDITLAVAGNVVSSTLAADDEFSLAVAGSVRSSAITSGDTAVTFNVRGNVLNSRFEGGLSGVVGGNVTNSTFSAQGNTLQNQDPDITLAVGGAMTGSSVHAVSQVTVNVAGNVSKSRFMSTTSDVTVNVGGNLTDSSLISADDGVTLSVGRDALNVQVVADDAASSLTIGRNFSGSVQSGSGNLFINVAGSVLNASSFTTGGDAAVDVGGNFDGSVAVRDLRYLVDGSVTKASRVVAKRVTEWADFGGTANFGIGGKLNGIVNVGVFDAASNVQTVTIVGGGAGQGSRFYVDRFETDTLVFNGNFNGNLRVLQDLVANLQFNGNVDRITVGGRIGSYASGNTIAPMFASVNVTGRLLYMNSNSYFQAIVPGVSGIFWNDATGSASTGTLTTGRYVTVVPTLQTQTAPGPLTPQQYTKPGVPTGFSASATTGPDGIKVTFAAPASNGNLPTVYYEYTTDNGTSWRRFSNLGQGPGSDIALPGPSTGGSSWSTGAPGYNVAVRAVNALGAGTATTAVPVTIAE